MASSQAFPWALGFRALGKSDLGPLISNDPSVSERSSSPRIWTLGTCHGTTLFYDPQTRTCMHGREPRQGWVEIRLWSPDGAHGLLLPDCVNAADHVQPVRVRFFDDKQCTLLSAKCGLEERLYTAKPPDAAWLPLYVPEVELTGEWEVATVHAATRRVGLHEKSLRALSRLIEERPSAADLVGRQDDATALRWFLAFQDFRYVDALGAEAIQQPGRVFMRRLGATARQTAVANAYESLADWIEGRDDAEVIEHLGPDFDVVEPWPGYAAFSIDDEIIARMRQHVAPRKGACVLATLRNEGPYILEWVAYHKSLGFEHFFIYTNDNGDASDGLLAELVKTGDVTLITNDARNVRPQYKAYGHAFKALPQILDYEWALVIDGDEFLVLAPDGRFRDIRHYTDWICARPADAIAFNWLVFNAFGVEEAELETPVTRRFVRRLDYVNEHIKSMVKPRYFVHSHAHYGFEIRGRLTRLLNSSGDPHRYDKEKAHSLGPVAEAAWINHYWSKSAQEFCGKLARKSGDLLNSYVRPLSEVEEMLGNLQRAGAKQNPVEDHRIGPRLEAMEKLVSDYVSNPAIRAAYEATVANQREHLETLSQEVADFRRRRLEARAGASIEAGAASR